MILDYAGACGILGALRSKSIKEQDLNILEEKNEAYILDFLKDYLEEKYPPTYELMFMEKALYELFLERVGKLYKFLGKRPRKILESLVQEFNLLNLSLALRKLKVEAKEDSLCFLEFSLSVFKNRRLQELFSLEELDKFLIKYPFLRRTFLRALKDLDFYKDLFYFDISLQRSYLENIWELSEDLDKKSSQLLKSFVKVKSLIYSLRLKFFQNRSLEEVRSLLPLYTFSKEALEVLKVSSFNESLDIINSSPLFLEFRRNISWNFEEELHQGFYKTFLEKRGINFFSPFVYLSFYLGQRYLTEKLIFIINNKLS